MIRALISIVVYLLIGFCLIYRVKTANGFVLFLKDKNNKENNYKLVLYFWPIVIAFLYGLYNKYVIGIQPVISGDRLNYLQDFNGRLTGFVIFDTYLRIVRSLTNDFSVLLALTTFLCCWLIFIALKKSIYKCVDAAVFIVLSYFIFTTLTALKQAPVSALAAIMIVVLIEKPCLKSDVLSIFIIFLSCGLHITGYVLIPVFILLRIKSIEKHRTIIILVLSIIVFVFFQQILMIFGQIVNPYFPNISRKIISYVAEDTIHASDGGSLLLAAFKGFPYYALSIIGLVDRKKHSKEQSYDKYLVLSILGALSSLLTLFSYWYSRISVLFIFPMAILYGMIMKNRVGKDKIIVCIVVIGSLAFFTIRSVFLNYINYGGY